MHSAHIRPGLRLTASVGALVLAGGLVACDSQTQAGGESSSPTDTAAPLTQSQAPSDAPHHSGTAAPLSIDDAFAAAVQAMIADDGNAFLTRASQDVYDRLRERQEGVDNLTWIDWDVMGGRPSSNPVVGRCEESVRPVYDGHQPVGEPNGTCELNIQQENGITRLLATFYLHRSGDGTWTVVDYVRAYQ